MSGPLAGLRVLDYGQYVAGPFATMLLSDLGADVVKVEPPGGDQWRHYDPFAEGESAYFHALNRGKRSVALDLKSGEGRERSRELIAGADALVHNCLPDRARAFGLDEAAVREVNPRCVVVSISAFGSSGPDADRPAYDLIAQALSGLLLADPRSSDAVPRRMGGLALADFTAGLLAALSVTAGLVARERGPTGPAIEVSLLGAALALQAQRFVECKGVRPLDNRRAGLSERAEAIEAAEALDPYYRAHRCADGFVALACLNTAQRERVCAMFGLHDDHAANPQAEPADASERESRLAHAAAVERGFAGLTVASAVGELGRRGVPAGEVRALEKLFHDPQATANGLVQTVEHPEAGPMRLLGNVFKVDGESTARGTPGPVLDEHRDELLRPERP